MAWELLVPVLPTSPKSGEGLFNCLAKICTRHLMPHSVLLTLRILENDGPYTDIARIN